MIYERPQDPPHTCYTPRGAKRLIRTGWPIKHLTQRVGPLTPGRSARVVDDGTAGGSPASRKLPALGRVHDTCASREK